MKLQSEGRSVIAHDLRQRQTESEEILWEELRDRRFDGWKFRRQRPIGPYFTDFCCEVLHLAAEIDGGIHQTEDMIEYDRERDEYIRRAGFTVIRFTDEDVERHMDKVKHGLSEAIVQILRSCKSDHPSPSGRGAGGEG